MAKDKSEKGLTAKETQKIMSGIKKSVEDKGKDITVWDILNWLFDGKPAEEIPNIFLRRQYKLRPLINSVMQKFRTNPRMLNFMNNQLNDLFSKRSESEIILFMKQYIQINRIQKSSLDQTWFQKSKREIFFEKIGQSKNDFEGGFGDLVSHYDLLSTGRFEDKLSQSIINDVTGVVVSNEEIENNLAEFMIAEQQAKIDNDPRFIKDLTQEVIDDLSLSLIDIKSLEKLNKILLVFLDKNNLKKYYMYDFSYEFVISNLFSIIQNDYVVPFTKEYHQSFIINDMRTLENIKRTLRTERDKFYKQFAWIPG